MMLSKPRRILIGVLVGVYLLLNVALAALIVPYALAGGLTGIPTDGLITIEIVMLALVCGSALLQVGLLIGFGIHFVRRIVAAEESIDLVQLASGLGLLVMPFLAVPLYYIAYIAPEQPPEWASSTPITRDGG